LEKVYYEKIFKNFLTERRRETEKLRSKKLAFDLNPKHFRSSLQALRLSVEAFDIY